MSPLDLVEHLKRARLRHTSEFVMQGDLYQLLDDLKIQYAEEARLSAKDIVDVLTADGVAIECKIKGQPMAIWRQIERYAQYEEVKSIILLTAKHMGVKPEIGGKPVHIVKVGMGWI